LPWIVCQSGLSSPRISETILSIMIGTVATLPIMVMNYWLGSSAGSARKDATLAKTLTAGAPTVP
jgi:hypothetical protein